MDSRCEGPQTLTCLDQSTVAGCQDGFYSESSCEGEEVCVESGESARCQVPGEEDDTGESGGGQDSQTVDTGSTGAGESGGGEDTENLDPNEQDRANESEPGCGCASVRNHPGTLVGVLLVGVVLRRRRRTRLLNAEE